MYVVSKLKEQQRSKMRLRQNVCGAAGYGGSESAAVWGPNGWLTCAISYLDSGGQDPLVCHADFLGPVKLIGDGGNIRRLTEVFVSRELFGDQIFDGESKEECDSLLTELDATVFADQSPGEQQPWRPPEAERLVAWLRAGGFQPAVDDDGNLRLTLKARGCDGQVRVCRDDQRLRMTMRLGSWGNLDVEREQAMLRLARQANDRGRLARIAWIVEGNSRRCDAQVDLTGLPIGGPAERIWSDMLCMSMHGLGLALRRLGMELDALADPKNGAVAAQLIQ